MKAKKTLFVRFVSINDLRKSVGEILKTKKAYSTPENVVEFGDHAGYNRFMNFNKEVILSSIRSAGPESIYQLAKLVSRGQPSVHKDCQSLERMGFIKLVRTEENRGQVRPELSFDYSEIVIEGTSISINLENNVKARKSG